jgi:phage terminase large subunit-like protein
MNRLLQDVLPVLAISLIAMPVPAFAEKAGTGTTAGDISQICEKEKIQKCRWEGDRKICEWVDGPNCAVYRTKTPDGIRATPSKLRR